MYYKIELLVITIIIVLTFRGLLDWFVYVIKTGARTAIYSKRVWTFSWIGLMIIVFWLLNDFSFCFTS